MEIKSTNLMTTLSPSAQSVMDAYWNTPSGPVTTQIHQVAVAAALRAVADQVVPSVPFDRRYITEDRWNALDDIRDEILTIAAELEGAA